MGVRAALKTQITRAAPKHKCHWSCCTPTCGEPSSSQRLLWGGPRLRGNLGFILDENSACAGSRKQPLPGTFLSYHVLFVLKRSSYFTIYFKQKYTHGITVTPPGQTLARVTLLGLYVLWLAVSAAESQRSLRNLPVPVRCLVLPSCPALAPAGTSAAPLCARQAPAHPLPGVRGKLLLRFVAIFSSLLLPTLPYPRGSQLSVPPSN